MNKKEREFQQLVKEYYEEHGRHDLPWRVDRRPFTAFISEVMLQQTQVPRVIEKYGQFMERFSGFEDIATAPQSEIVTLWQGLGYNRRALFLHRACKMIVDEFGGELPDSPEELIKLPGIGAATAGSLAVYAYNKPIPYIETNIRAVYIHHFFNDRTDVHDEELMPIIEKTLDKSDPYHWYSALMDYGTKIKSEHKNPSRKSRHHVKQSKFEGSLRQVRGEVLRQLSSSGGRMSVQEMVQHVDDDRFSEVMNQLISEGFVEKIGEDLLLK